MKKIVKKRQLFNNKLVLNIILVLFMFLTIGYSTLATNLNIIGNLNVKKYYEPTLYNVLAKEADTGGLARKYTGEHHDSFTEEPSKDIYHWYAENDTQGTQILDKNNVIFAGQCFQMIRTTDTGGVKMIYNGEAENNQCLDTRGTHVGYASRTSQNLASNYWYGTDYTYDSTNKVFSVSGTTEQTTWNETTSQGLIGKYTCKKTSVDGTCATLYLVESYNNTTTAYVIPLNSNSDYSQFGKLQFNEGYDSPSQVGYMYNDNYQFDKKYASRVDLFEKSFLNNLINYYYGSDISYDSSTNKYTLLNTTQEKWGNMYSSSGGLYTCKSSTETTCSTVYYIAGGDSSNSMYGYSLTGGNIYHKNIVLGSDYTESNGIYSLTETITISEVDWFNNYNSYKYYYTCGNDTTTCTNMQYLTATFNYYYYSLFLSDNYIYASVFTYNSETGVYTLGNDRIQTWNLTDDILNNLSTHHYTCFNDTGECTTISYVYGASLPTVYPYMHPLLYYINLVSGKDIETAFNELLVNDNINITDSIMKTGIDAWYKKYLINYSIYLEDTIFCNDRSFTSIDGWNPNGGKVKSSYIKFNNYDSNSDLSCSNSIDKFSMSNDKAKLSYPVGLLTYPEMNLLNNNNIRKNNQGYYLISPSDFYYGSFVREVTNTGAFQYLNIVNAFGVRPAISLIPGTKYTGGDGSMANPYVVDTSGN